MKPLSTALLPAALLLCIAGAPACGGSSSSADTTTASTTGGGAATIELEGTTYGDGITLAESTPLSELLSNPDTYAGQRVRLEGNVVDVCEKRGCWFEMAGDEEFQAVRFKVVDGVMVFPMSMKGKYAVMEGTAEVIEMSLEETRESHALWAKENGESFDPESVTEPDSYMRIAGLGAVVRDAR